MPQETTAPRVVVNVSAGGNVAVEVEVVGIHLQGPPEAPPRGQADSPRHAPEPQAEPDNEDGEDPLRGWGTASARAPQPAASRPAPPPPRTRPTPAAKRASGGPSRPAAPPPEVLELAKALRADGTLSPRSRVARAFFGGVAAREARIGGSAAAPLPELQLRNRVWLGETAGGAPRVFYRWAECERLAAAERRRLQGFPSVAEAKAFVAGAEQPWP